MGKRRQRRTRKWLPIAIVAVLAAIVVTLAATLSITRPETPAAVADYTPKPMPPETPMPALPLSPGTRTVIMGDSWTAGYGADDPDEEGYAVLVGRDLGLNYTLDYVSGTGYFNAGATGQDTYVQRLERTPVDPTVQLLIIQGSGNDAGQKQEVLRERIAATIRQARVTYPNASVVLIGPAPLRFPLKGDVPAMDASLASVAPFQLARYISPYRSEWFTPENAEQMIDPEKLYHPYTVGHRYFADQVIAALRAFAETTS